MGTQNDETNRNTDFAKKHPRRILVAEDGRVNQTVIRGIFSSLGYEVTLVENGQLAIDQLGEQEFDIVFLDLQMPVLDGFDALALIRKTHSKEELPIIMLSANSGGPFEQSCIEKGANDVLGKPMDVDKLCRILTS